MNVGAPAAAAGAVAGPEPAVATPDPVPFVDLGAEYRAISAEVRTAIGEVLDRGDFVLGSSLEHFEAAFARYCGVGHAVGVDSGFSALELAMRACGIGRGDEVITVANTFVATVAAIESTGARPVLVDADAATHQIDPAAVAAAITPATRAVVPVHLYGNLADLRAIRAVADRHGLVVIEDACQAHGARLDGRRAGSLGTAGAFSFYPSKNLGAYGDGGMVVTDDPLVAERVRMLRNLGSRAKYHHEIKGFNRRLDTIQAAVLTVKLARLDQRNEARRRLAALYDGLLDRATVTVPSRLAGSESVHHLYVVDVEHRDRLQRHLAANGVSTGVHYPVPVHLQPAHADLGYGPGDFPVAERLARCTLSLPMFPELEGAQVRRIVELVHSHPAGSA